MKTTVTFLIALLAFASTLAWAGPEQGAGRAASAATQNQPVARNAAQATTKAAERAAKPARNAPGHGASPVLNYGFELPSGPAVICACVAGRNLS